jgi:hypothetical protein
MHILINKHAEPPTGPGASGQPGQKQKTPALPGFSGGAQKKTPALPGPNNKKKELSGVRTQNAS